MASWLRLRHCSEHFYGWQSFVMTARRMKVFQCPNDWNLTQPGLACLAMPKVTIDVAHHEGAQDTV